MGSIGGIFFFEKKIFFYEKKTWEKKLVCHKFFFDRFFNLSVNCRDLQIRHLHILYEGHIPPNFEYFNSSILNHATKEQFKFVKVGNKYKHEQTNISIHKAAELKEIIECKKK